jgi:hypothetical protein
MIDGLLRALFLSAIVTTVTITVGALAPLWLVAKLAGRQKNTTALMLLLVNWAVVGLVLARLWPWETWNPVSGNSRGGGFGWWLLVLAELAGLAMVVQATQGRLQKHLGSILAVAISFVVLWVCAGLMFPKG